MIFLIIALFGISWEEKPVEFLPSFNSWAISFQLTHDETLRKSVNLTEDQLAKVIAMRQSTRMLGVLNHLKERFPPKSTTSFSSNSGLGNLFQDEYFLKAEPQVVEALNEILNPPQMAILRPNAMRIRFRDPMTAFQSAEVRYFLRLDNKIIAEMDGKIEKHKKEYVVRRLSLQAERSRNVVDSLDANSRLLFAQVIGTKYIPHVVVNDSQPISSIPYSPLSKSKSQVLSLVDNEPLLDSLELNVSQRTRLQEWKSEMQRLDGNKSIGQKAPQSADRLLDDAKAFERLSSILSLTQLHQYCRSVSALEFDRKPLIYFSQPVCSYLGLDTDEVAAIKETIERETNRIERNSSEWKQRTFHELCDLMPESQAVRMKQLFEGVW